ncbi:hypothetical protein CIL03_13645 [Virgibacillus indicus]|uniref:Uncharacterized protein n=1 Tax=Virgibacillus indicus TaxID=2024554 RepID=A0A265N838_9BACI|nr:hypothetical protein [Virgibacillus indicus]OZU88162.1 hypothetical protein CIL03_13645 [Virgibacillus indicus]
MNESELYNQIYQQKEQLGSLISEYWNLYSGMDTWYFWFNVASVLIPLVILYFAIDRQRIFEISFFGFAVHVLWANIDSILSSNNYLVHAHTLTHLIPSGITMTA